MKNIIVIYHKNCPDGVMSASLAYEEFGDAAEYIPCSDRQVPPEYVTNHTDKSNTRLYILDFSYPFEVLKNLEEEFADLIILDHHQSVMGDVLSIKHGQYSDKNCASIMAYEFFKNKKGGELPNFIKMIDIIDLHRDERNENEDMIAYVNSLHLDFKSYLEAMYNYDRDYDDYKAKGAAINRYVTILEEMAIDNFDTVEFEGHIMPAVNVAYDINTKSRILRKLYEIMPPMAMSYRYDEGQWKVSLRGDGSIDVSAIAAKYGGGGHKSSAGFVVKADGPLPFARHIFKS